MVFPLLVFDPGGNGSIAMWVAFLPDVSRIFALRTRHSKEGGMIRSLLHGLHALLGSGLRLRIAPEFLELLQDINAREEMVTPRLSLDLFSC